MVDTSIKMDEAKEAQEGVQGAGENGDQPQQQRPAPEQKPALEQKLSQQQLAGVAMPPPEAARPQMPPQKTDDEAKRIAQEARDAYEKELRTETMTITMDMKTGGYDLALPKSKSMACFLLTILTAEVHQRLVAPDMEFIAAALQKKKGFRLFKNWFKG